MVYLRDNREAKILEKLTGLTINIDVKSSDIKKIRQEDDKIRMSKLENLGGGD